MMIDYFYVLGKPGTRVLNPAYCLCRPVAMPPQMTQPAHSAPQMLPHMSRQNGAPQSVTPSSTNSPLHGPSGGWPGPGPAARPQFSNQVTQVTLCSSLFCSVTSDFDWFFVFIFLVGPWSGIHRRIFCALVFLVPDIECKILISVISHITL